MGDDSKTGPGSMLSLVAYVEVAVREHVDVGESIERDDGAGECASLVGGDTVLDKSGRLKLRSVHSFEGAAIEPHDARHAESSRLGAVGGEHDRVDAIH